MTADDHREQQEEEQEAPSLRGRQGVLPEKVTGTQRRRKRLSRHRDVKPLRLGAHRRKSRRRGRYGKERRRPRRSNLTLLHTAAATAAAATAARDRRHVPNGSFSSDPISPSPLRSQSLSSSSAATTSRAAIVVAATAPPPPPGLEVVLGRFGGPGAVLPHVPLLCRVPIKFQPRTGTGTSVGAGAGAEGSQQQQRQRFLLSRRYARAASDSFLSSRSPVQARSVPRFSSSSSSSLGSSSSSHRRRSFTGSASVGPEAATPTTTTTTTAAGGGPESSPAAAAAAAAYDRLFEDLVFVTLERRLADRLARARGIERVSSSPSTSSPPAPGHSSAPTSVSSPAAASTSEAAASSSCATASESEADRARGPPIGSCRRAAAQAAAAERAGLGGIRPGREMWIWSAVRRTRDRQEKRRFHGDLTWRVHTV
ncbi:hypothetical protein JCM3774_005557 [Rhodotorula dairenensis]